MGHYFIDIFALFPPIKHWLNMTWDIITILVGKEYTMKYWSMKYIWDYYGKARKAESWVY